MIDLVLSILSIFIAFKAIAGNKLFIPKFVTIKSNEVNARTGPSIKSPIEWVFIKKGEPVKITASYDHWRCIEDIKGEGGWVHLSLLSSKRAVIITEKRLVAINQKPSSNSKVLARLMPGLRCRLNKCKLHWCYINCKNYEGWLEKKSIWGVYDYEILN